MNTNPILATIKSKFDLGYIVLLENGIEAQLRLPELKGRERELHIAGTEELIYGEKILVYVTYQDERYCSVSQLSPSERQERHELTERKARAQKDCVIGNIYVVRIDKDYDWGYLCSQVDGFLSGAIKKPTAKLEIGQQLAVTVVDKNKWGAPYFEVGGA